MIRQTFKIPFKEFIIAATKHFKEGLVEMNLKGRITLIILISFMNFMSKEVIAKSTIES